MTSRLALAEKHLAQCIDQIGKQGKVIAELERAGRDATDALKVLDALCSLQGQHEARRDGIKRQLENWLATDTRR